jgi:hypothetical protein
MPWQFQPMAFMACFKQVPQPSSCSKKIFLGVRESNKFLLSASLLLTFFYQQETVRLDLQLQFTSWQSGPLPCRGSEQVHRRGG